MTSSILTNVRRHGFRQTFAQSQRKAEDISKPSPKPKYAHIRRINKQAQSSHNHQGPGDGFEVDLYRQVKYLDQKDKNREVTVYKKVFEGGPAADVVHVVRDKDNGGNKKARVEMGRSAKKTSADKDGGRKKIIPKESAKHKASSRAARAQDSMFDDDCDERSRHGKSRRASSSRHRSCPKSDENSHSRSTQGSSYGDHGLSRSCPQRTSTPPDHLVDITCSATDHKQEKRQTNHQNKPASHWKQPYLTEEQSIDFVFGVEHQTSTIRQISNPASQRS